MCVFLVILAFSTKSVSSIRTEIETKPKYSVLEISWKRLVSIFQEPNFFKNGETDRTAQCPPEQQDPLRLAPPHCRRSPIGSMAFGTSDCLWFDALAILLTTYLLLCEVKQFVDHWWIDISKRKKIRFFEFGCLLSLNDWSFRRTNRQIVANGVLPSC